MPRAGCANATSWIDETDVKGKFKKVLKIEFLYVQQWNKQKQKNSS